MLRPALHNRTPQRRAHSAFTLVELLAVIAIMALLMAVSVQIFSNTSGEARKASRDVIKAQLQQARAHAIATGNATAVVVPLFGSSGELGARAISSFEVQKSGNTYAPVVDANGNERLLQRWEILPGNTHFVPAAMISSGRPTLVDTPETLQIRYNGRPVTCHFIVFASNGQIVQPATAVHIAIANASSRGGNLVITEKAGGKPIFEFLQVNRLSGRTRSVLP
jgi:prepilin-type N-terminal cleavage/methylation domain-containing protein